MIRTEIEVKVICNSEEEVLAAKKKLQDTNFQIHETAEPFQFMATMVQTFNSKEEF